ncbi:hypothetical protein BU15DRAFT_89456 [Melanogaster broomeanus]|nr:hypothetical protein BU15DRAFT_89456 [Melanogaster broomeanus]
MSEQAQDESPPPVGPLPIQRLHESLINRIAAGRGSCPLALHLNSLDAGATSIRVTVKDGGMKLLQIQDNGCGIRKADLPILAERFTTSKLKTFSDLSRLTTYGFRGEALASMSHVAHMSVVTKTKTDSCAWKAYYSEGALVPPKAGQTTDPKPCAGNDGTVITIEDMFYNTPTRLSALRGSSEEYARILDVVTKYAVHNPNVSFLCKKVGSSTPELSTSPTLGVGQAIRLSYGHSIGKELLHVEVSSSRKGGSSSRGHAPDGPDDPERWSAEAYCTSPNYQAKKTVFLLFINHRLVESSSIKRAIESLYSGVLPKGAYPFVYLSIEIDPRSVDVNVHPTKREVIFLNEETITERISDAIQQRLVRQSHSRVFEYQTLLPGRSGESSLKRAGKRVREDEDETKKEKAKERTEERKRKKKKNVRLQRLVKQYSQHKVRTSLHDRTLESMIPVANPSRSDGGDASGKAVGLRDIQESSCDLTSVSELRQLVRKNMHHDLTEIMKKHTFVGIVDNYRCLSLIQHATNLYLVNHAALAEEMFYQLALMQFGSYRRLKLDPSPPLRTLLKLAVDAEPETERSGLSKDEIVDRIAKKLLAQRVMLSEYFGMNITAGGEIQSLPHLLKEYTPDLNKLPAFLMRLGPQVQWQSERECFYAFMRELAYFYSPSLSHFIPSLPNGEKQEKSTTWQTEHVLFQALRKFLVAPKSLLENDVVQVASLPDLYRVFERC